MPEVPDLARIRAVLAAREARRLTDPASRIPVRGPPAPSARTPPGGTALAFGEPCTSSDLRAAVAAVLRQADEPEVLLIRRADHPEDPWSGHMAFPGGRHDREDPDLLHTAVRETLEEVGLDLGRQAALIGRLDEVPAIARGRKMGMGITPFVFELADLAPRLRPNHEVQEVVWAPIGPLLRGEADTTMSYTMDGETWHLPAFDVGGRTVWGLTYQMLQHLFSILRQG